jgi:hypothetical protein
MRHVRPFLYVAAGFVAGALWVCYMLEATTRELVETSRSMSVAAVGVQAQVHRCRDAEASCIASAARADQVEARCAGVRMAPWEIREDGDRRWVAPAER